MDCCHQTNNKLLDIMHSLVDYNEGFIKLNVASRSTFEAIDKSSWLFKRRREFGRFLETYRSLGFTIKIEIKKENNSKFTYEINKFKIILPKEQVEDINIGIQNNEVYQCIVSETYYKVMQDCDLGLGITKHCAKSFMDDYIMGLENGINKTNIIRTIRKNIQENVHSYLWHNILSCSFLSNFIIGETLDLSHNKIQIIPDNFVKFSASKIDLRGNNLQQVPNGFEHMKSVILEYDPECRYLSQQIQNERETFRSENPINIKAINNHSKYTYSLVKTRREDVGDVSRLFVKDYGKENLSDPEIMQKVIDMHADGNDIHYNIVDDLRFVRCYNECDVRMTQLASERERNPKLASDFSRYFY